MLYHDKQIEIDMREILDTFSGVDGGVSFIKFRCMVEGLDQAAKDGDVNAEQCLEIVKSFTRLIRYAKERKS